MIVLDTNVLSELMRPAPSAQVSAWAARQAAAELFTTAITEAEIFYGIELVSKGKRRDGLLSAAEALFNETFANRVLGFDSSAAQAYAQILAHCRRIGKPIAHADAQIAAIAYIHKAPLATRNISHFEACGISLINPWES
ncbi:MAG TPA: type II toxin-antitoxin system VapC family toxin [Terriglobales bacterium]|nr:type II toxin-antitoxin system VapC family toxin [Terriglobales bacterium]